MQNPYSVNPVASIPRSLEEATDYSPQWRFDTATHYVAEILKSENPSTKVASIWVEEPDELVLHVWRWPQISRASSAGV
jgi:hypothetical protein